MLKLTEKTYRLAAFAIFAVLIALVVGTFRDYGVTWDEELQSQYGLAVVDYYQSFFEEQRYREIFNLYLYGGMFDGFASIFDRLTPFSLYETRHLLNALFGLLGLWGTWRLGRQLGGGRVGLLALVMLTLTPMYYGHMFNNPKDIPFAAGIVWSLYYMGRITAGLPRPSWKSIIMMGLIFGLTLGIRVGGAMLFGYFLVVLAVDIVRRAWRDRDISAFDLFLRYGLRIVLPAGLLAYAMMLVCWPWAQQSPIINPWRALVEFSHFPQDVEVQLDGVTYRSTQLPWYYVPLYFGVQLPEFLLAALALAPCGLLLGWRKLKSGQQELLLIMVMMAGAPIVFAMIGHPALYDAVRHFLFTVPLACTIAALALIQIWNWAKVRFAAHQTYGLGFLALAATFIADVQITLMVRLHPYEYIFVNQFAGGVSGAYGRYELDYWGSSFKEAASELQSFVAAEGGVPSGKIYKIAICGPWSSAMMYLPPDYEPVVANEPAEFFLSTTRWECQHMRPGNEIISIDRLGAPLAVIKDLRHGYEHYEGNEHEKK